jgi:hypothetical protein
MTLGDEMSRDCDVEPDDTMVRIKRKRIYDPQHGRIAGGTAAAPVRSVPARCCAARTINIAGYAAHAVPRAAADDNCTGTDQEQQDMTRNSYATADPKTLKASGCNPNQLCAEQQAQLVAEVKHQGRLLKPIVVRDDGGQLVIVDGEQNWAAALRAWSGRGTD